MMSLGAGGYTSGKMPLGYMKGWNIRIHVEPDRPGQREETANELIEEHDDEQINSNLNAEPDLSE